MCSCVFTVFIRFRKQVSKFNIFLAKFFFSGFALYGFSSGTVAINLDECLMFLKCVGGPVTMNTHSVNGSVSYCICHVTFIEAECSGARVKIRVFLNGRCFGCY